MRIRKSVMDSTTITPGANDVRGTQQPQGLRDHVLGYLDDGRQVTHAELAGHKQRMQNRHTRRIAQQSEQLRCLASNVVVRQPST